MDALGAKQQSKCTQTSTVQTGSTTLKRAERRTGGLAGEGGEADTTKETGRARKTGGYAKTGVMIGKGETGRSVTGRDGAWEHHTAILRQEGVLEAKIEETMQ